MNTKNHQFPFKVVLVDDDEMNFEIIQDILLNFPRLSLVGYEPTPEGFKTLVERSNPDIALVDLNLRTGNEGLDVIEWLVEDHPMVKPVVITVNTQLISEAFKRGAYGYCLKNHWEELPLTIMRVADGETCMPGSVVSAIVQFVESEKEKSKRKEELLSLTLKEREILKLLGSGIPKSDLCMRLDISEKTLKRHLENIRERCHIRSIREVLTYFGPVL